MVFTISLLKFSDELNFSMRQECPPRNHVNWVDLELKDMSLMTLWWFFQHHQFEIILLIPNLAKMKKVKKAKFLNHLRVNQIKLKLGLYLSMM